MVQKYTTVFVETLQNKLYRQQRKISERISELKHDDPFSDPDHVNDNAAVDTDVREQVNHATASAKIKELELRLSKIDAALEKIKKGRFGSCENCGQTIPMERLKIVPEETLCIKCKKKLVV